MSENQEIVTIEETEPVAEEVVNEPAAEEVNQSPGENEALRAEVERLRGEVTRLSAWQERTRSEMEEFCSLFPSVSLASLPPEVREQVDAGVPLPAAYALFEKRETYRAAAGKKSADSAWRGMNETAGGDYYSPAEVKGMSQKEVHKNYKKIIESMKHWK
ncbi:MAG: hypothetical protein E7606_03020 [Ruminococcaceae bacterium]|nr:hypothetical protein [Oscillospiraceae bacterium]